MTRHIELIPPSQDSTIDLCNWRLCEYEVDEDHRATQISRQVIDFRDRTALLEAVAPLGTREDSRRWLTEQGEKAAYPGDERALKAVAWLLKETEREKE